MFHTPLPRGVLALVGSIFFIASCGDDEVKKTITWPDTGDTLGEMVIPWDEETTPEPDLSDVTSDEVTSSLDTVSLDELESVDIPLEEPGIDTVGTDSVETDTWVFEDGTVEHPYIVPFDPYGVDYTHTADTSDSSVSLFDTYPPNETDECGTEIYYLLEVDEAIQLMAWIDSPEPDGVDVDVHLLGSLDPLELIDRGHYSVEAMLEAGTYWIVMDTYCSDGVPMPGPYHLTVSMQLFSPGTVDEPVPLGGSAPLTLPFGFNDVRDTTSAASDVLDAYPPNDLDMSGPEVIYTFSVDEPARVMAYIEAPEPAGTDIDLNLLAEMEPLVLIARDDKIVYEIVEPGTYWIVADTYVDGAGDELAGSYVLHLSVREKTPPPSAMFNDYILAAVDWLYANYGLLGYGSAALTHDIPYGDQGYVEATNPPLTMCVAAVMETILTAMNIYADETGDETVFDFLPKWSFEGFQGNCIKAHIWVNYDLEAGGTADALLHFGMGYNVPFEELSPGSVNYINWRTSDYGFVTGATANMNPPKDITITTPAADGYTLIEGEETTFTWDSDGNIQLITIETDYIGVLQANEEYYVIANTGEFDYTPQANFQGFTVKEYPDSSTLAQRTVVSQLATTLNNPNASTGSVLGGDTLDIHWVAPPSVNKVKLEYSNDGGITWNTIVLTTENDGEYRWVVPNMAMNTTVQVQVTEISAAANASASPNFTVYPAPDRDGSWKFTETGSHNQMHVTFEDVDFFMEAPTYTALITTVESVFIGAFYEDGEGGVKCAGYTRLVSTTAGWGNDAQDNETDGGSGAETVSLTIYGDDLNTSELDGVPQTSPATNVIFKAWRYQWSVQDPDIDSPAGDGNDRTASPWNTTTNNVQAVGFTAGNIVVVDELQYIRGSNVSAPEQQLIPLSDAGNWLMISGYVTPSVLDFNYLGPASATTSDQILTDVRTSIATTQRQGFMTNTGQDNFVMIKDGDGSVYWWVSTSIGLVVTPTTFTKWDVDKGYMIKTSAAANVGDLALYGQPIDYSSRPIPLKAGWNLIPYTRKDSMNIGAALGSISGYYRIVKDQQGNIFWPAYSINDIGYMVANEAYLVYMDEATELLYPTSNSGPKMKNPVPYRAAPDATRYNVNYNSDNSSTIVFLESAFNETPQIGDEIGVFNKYGKLVGSATYAGGNVAITVWGVESGAEKGHGVKEGEEYVFKLFSKADGSEATLGGLTYMVGSGKYAAGAWSVISAVETVGEDVPTEFALSQNFPNPFNPTTTIEFALPRAANVELKVYNLLGEVVATVAQGAFDAGYHQVTFNAANLASGIYFYSIEADDFTSVKKMTLLK
jgi:hypothetical protein